MSQKKIYYLINIVPQYNTCLKHRLCNYDEKFVIQGKKSRKLYIEINANLNQMSHCRVTRKKSFLYFSLK